MKCIPLTLLLIALTVAPAQAQGGNFGTSLGISDHEILVGQSRNSDAPGAVIAFRPDGEGWSVSATLTASDATEEDGFGRSFVAHDQWLAIGAPDHAGGSGAVYVFERDADTGTWLEAAQLTVEGLDGKIGGALGSADNTIVVGAPDSGAVYVFRKEAGAWVQSARLVGDDAMGGDRFGAGVAIDEERIYVGAPGHNDGAGAVYVFQAESHAEETKLESDDEEHKALGAILAAPGGGLLLSGAPGQRMSQRGRRVRILDQPMAGDIVTFSMDEAGAWTQRPSIEGPEDLMLRFYGFLPFSATQERLLLGSPRGEVVYVYTRDAATGGWVEGEKIEGGASDRSFGQAVALKDDMAVISAPGANYSQGVAVAVTFGDEVTKIGRMSLVREIQLVANGPADCEDEIAWQFDCSNVDLLSFLPIADISLEGSSARLNDIWGWTDPETDHEYALVGRTNGTAFVDVTDPLNPVFVGDMPLPEGARPSSWRDIKVYDNHAFVVADAADSHGVQIFDLTQLREIMEPPATFEATARYHGVHSAHNIVINEESGFAFAVGSSGGGDTCGGGLHMIDVRNPANPTFAGCFAHNETGRAGTGYSHDAQCVIYRGEDLEHRGKEICFGSNETALSIADITDKENPVALSSATYPNVAYAHQGWLTDDHAHFYMNDELDELQGEIVGTRTLIWDVTDLDDPQLLVERRSDNQSSDHNLYIKDDLMYQSNYLSGLRIFDITDVTNPVEVGFFDTVPVGEDRPGFGGSWSNYPYFKSGSIVVTSMGEGLFVLKKRSIDT